MHNIAQTKRKPHNTPPIEPLQNFNPISEHSQSNKTNYDSIASNSPDLLTLSKCKNFNINLVRSLKQRIKTTTLIKHMYASRGYRTDNNDVFLFNPNQFTFEAADNNNLLGTLTLTIDSEEGLLADKLYQQEIDGLRTKGRKICELSKLVINTEYSQHNSKEIISSLFLACRTYAHTIYNVTDFLCEVNPRHAKAQKHMFGFQMIGEKRICPRVNAPAVLLHLATDT